MRFPKSTFLLFGVGLILAARLAVFPHLPIVLPLPPTATPDSRLFEADQTVIPAGGCVTLSWSIPFGARAVLRGSNWPEGVQDGVAQTGSSIVCPSAATHYVPDEPVTYTLRISYPDGHSNNQAIVIRYEGVADAQPVPSATLDPNATPAGIPVTPDATVAAVYQSFENGWMIWRGDTDTVLVLLGDGTLLAYMSNAIQAQPLYEPAPPGRFAADELLIDVWHTSVGESPLRTVIGWATAPAQTYSARAFGQVMVGFGMTLPDGRYVGLSFGGAWVMGGITLGKWTVSGAPVTFMPPSVPTLTPTPRPTPTLFGAVYQDFERGFMVGAEDGRCAYIFAYSEDYPDGGIVIPADIRTINDISSGYHYCIEFDGLPNMPTLEPAPLGLQNPVGSFGRAWAYYADVRAALGYASAPEQHYISALPPAEVILGGGPFSIPQLRLPDGRLLSCGFRAATAGMCRVG